MVFFFFFGCYMHKHTAWHGHIFKIESILYKLNKTFDFRLSLALSLLSFSNAIYVQPLNNSCYFAIQFVFLSLSLRHSDIIVLCEYEFIPSE